MSNMVMPKWAAGASYGPVLTQQELYLLDQPVELHPILEGRDNFHLSFNLCTGQTGGFREMGGRDAGDIPFDAKDQPATLPRVEKLYIITNSSPWCTTIKNEKGVTMADVCTALWKDYTEHYVTDGEFASLQPRAQEQIKRQAAANQVLAGGNNAWGGYYTPTVVPGRYKRVDWLKDRVWFDGLRKSDDYIRNRLGYSAPNIFEMVLST